MADKKNDIQTVEATRVLAVAQNSLTVAQGGQIERPQRGGLPVKFSRRDAISATTEAIRTITEGIKSGKPDPEAILNGAENACFVADNCEDVDDEIRRVLGQMGGLFNGG